MPYPRRVRRQCHARLPGRSHGVSLPPRGSSAGGAALRPGAHEHVDDRGVRESGRLHPADRGDDAGKPGRRRAVPREGGVCALAEPLSVRRERSEGRTFEHGARRRAGRRLQ
jgi:hypothetical protein